MIGAKCMPQALCSYDIFFSMLSNSCGAACYANYDSEFRFSCFVYTSAFCVPFFLFLSLRTLFIFYRATAILKYICYLFSSYSIY